MVSLQTGFGLPLTPAPSGDGHHATGVDHVGLRRHPL